MLTLSELLEVKGEQGNFDVEILQQPRYVDFVKCIGCGTCSEKCPKKVDDSYNEGLEKRKAIYVPYAQAVPLKYAIDRDHCIYFQKGKCKACEKFCPTNAIKFEDSESTKSLKVGSIVLAPGFQTFDPLKFDKYRYAKHPNVITSIELERILSASGPTMGHLVRPSDGKEPKNIAWLQCVGSRDINQCDHGYCSSVCCMYAIKEAVIAKEHSANGLDCAVFYMDIRTHGKDFERYYDGAKEKHGVRFIRSRTHVIEPIEETDQLLIKYASEGGDLLRETFDMIVLSVGLETPSELLDLAQKLNLDLTEGGFCQTESLHPTATNREGIFVCGAFQGPKDIPQSIIEAGSAAAAAGSGLSPVRNSLTKAKEEIPQRNVIGERPRIGVFVCHCGTNIAGVVDVPGVAEYAKSLPYVEYVTDTLYACAQDTQESISQAIEENNLNRIVVSACTPKTHEALFQETLIDAGLNKYLFEMTNIRNQDSWVHKDNPDLATEKAKDLVRMSVAKVALMESLRETALEINQKALVLGGGVSGLVSAKTLSEQGYQVCLVERKPTLGGQALNLFRTWKGEDVQKELAGLITAVENDNNIEVRLGTELANVDGFVGSFSSTLKSEDKESNLEHGIAVLATGASEFQPTEYLYGQDPRVHTHLELDRKFIDEDPSLKDVKTAVFIQCVGSREPERPYCSRVCCTHSVESALRLKEINPDMNIYILYRDIRTYGEREYLYKKARGAGIVFVRFSLDRKPQVSAGENGLNIQFLDNVLRHPITLQADLLTLASAIIPERDEKLAQFFKVPMNEDGFFVEAHAKLGPSEFAIDGLFLCGLAHYPKPMDESVAQAQAASSRAITLLARETISMSGMVAAVDTRTCSSCGVCMDVCPYKAPSFISQGPLAGKAEVNPALCKGCGLCIASCRSGAINLSGFETGQIMAMINES